LLRFNDYDKKKGSLEIDGKRICMKKKDLFKKKMK